MDGWMVGVALLENVPASGLPVHEVLGVGVRVVDGGRQVVSALAEGFGCRRRCQGRRCSHLGEGVAGRREAHPPGGMHARTLFLGGDEDLLGEGGGVRVSRVVHELGQDTPAVLGVLEKFSRSFQK